MLIKKNSVINNNVKVEKQKVLKKRRHSQIVDENQVIESQKKLNKLKKIKLEKDENVVEDNITNDLAFDNSSEFKEFIKHFAIPSNIYKHLSNRNKLNPIILKRSLSYNNINQHGEFSRSNAQSVIDHLSKAPFDTDKGKLSNASKVKSFSKISIKFEQFIDNKLQKDWETVEAFIYVDIVHLHRDNRKNKDGFFTNRVISNHQITCNRIMPDDSPKFVIDIEEIMRGVSIYRVYKSMLHFKILAKEKKLFTRNICQDKKCDDLFPVTYEAMMPIFSNKDEHHMHKDTYLIHPGKYELYPRVTDMEKCDDSMFSGVIPDGYNSEEERTEELDSEWVLMDDIQLLNDNRNNTKFVFTIADEEPPKAITKQLKNRNKNQIPVVELMPIDNGGYRDSNTKNRTKLKNDINLAFKFLVGSNVVQWTQTHHLTCPWCQLNFSIKTDLFSTLTIMMTHLNFMHPKFTFTCKKLSNSAIFAKSLSKKFVTIDVRLTEVSTTDWDIGLMVTEKLPARRMPLTEIIYSKYQRKIEKRYRGHHPRDYCHTWSSLKSKYLEFDIDSECEENMAWMYDHYERKVEEFSDLNRIEKRVIQMWNESLLRYGVQVGDHQMPRFVERFIADLCDAGSRVTEVRSLRNTLLLHLVNLVDYGLLAPVALVRAMRTVDAAIASVAV